jgi:shikimate kinase
VKNNVVLVGFMGVGKTTLGKRLAKLLDFQFVDTDELLEQLLGCSISSYFEKFGETKFREKERYLLQEWNDERCVIATGGGMPCFHDNMERLKQIGVVAYLHRPSKELHHRLIHAKKKRPLVSELTDDELLTFIEKTLTQREPIYKQAHLVIGRDAQQAEDVQRLLIPFFVGLDQTK